MLELTARNTDSLSIETLQYIIEVGRENADENIEDHNPSRDNVK